MLPSHFVTWLSPPLCTSIQMELDHWWQCNIWGQKPLVSSVGWQQARCSRKLWKLIWVALGTKVAPCTVVPGAWEKTHFSNLLTECFRPGEEPPWRVWVIEWSVLGILDLVARLCCKPSVCPAWFTSARNKGASRPFLPQPRSDVPGVWKLLLLAFEPVVPWGHTPRCYLWVSCSIHCTQHSGQRCEDTVTKWQRFILLGQLTSCCHKDEFFVVPC